MTLYTSELEIRIPFHDLDPMCIVWHGNYIKYMEQARCDMFAKLNYTYRDMKKDNYAYPVAKMNTKFIKPAIFDEELIIRTTLQEIEPSMNIKYEIFDKNTSDKIFEANTMQIAINIKTMESLYNAPEKLIKILEDINEK